MGAYYPSSHESSSKSVAGTLIGATHKDIVTMTNTTITTITTPTSHAQHSNMPISDKQDSNSNTIKIRLGNVVYETPIDLLLSAGGMLATMFSNTMKMKPSATDDSGAYIIFERDPHLFRYILQLLEINDKSKWPLELEGLSSKGLAMLLEEADFFQVHDIHNVVLVEITRRNTTNQQATKELNDIHKELQRQRAEINRLNTARKWAVDELDETKAKLKHQRHKNRKLELMSSCDSPTCPIGSIVEFREKHNSGSAVLFKQKSNSNTIDNIGRRILKRLPSTTKRWSIKQILIGRGSSFSEKNDSF